jgi:cytochrome c-type biogenesis protein CcmH/NrfF
MKLNDNVQEMYNEGKSVEEITDYIMNLITAEDRKRTKTDIK